MAPEASGQARDMKYGVGKAQGGNWNVWEWYGPELARGSAADITGIKLSYSILPPLELGLRGIRGPGANLKPRINPCTVIVLWPSSVIPPLYIGFSNPYGFECLPGIPPLYFNLLAPSLSSYPEELLDQVLIIILIAEKKCHMSKTKTKRNPFSLSKIFPAITISGFNFTLWFSPCLSDEKSRGSELTSFG